MNKASTKLAIGIILAVIVCTTFLALYLNHKSITTNAISNLERQLEEQGELTTEQEKQLEELAKVTCKEIQVPYDAQESYTEQEPYSDEVCENVNLIYKKENGNCVQYSDKFFADDKPASYSCTITNLDTHGGVFSVEMGFVIDGQNLVETQNKYIYPQSYEIFYAQKMAYVDNCICYITSIPTKQECETITRYRPVTMYRTVTKYRTETICE